MKKDEGRISGLRMLIAEARLNVALALQELAEGKNNLKNKNAAAARVAEAESAVEFLHERFIKRQAMLAKTRGDEAARDFVAEYRHVRGVI